MHNALCVKFFHTKSKKCVTLTYTQCGLDVLVKIKAYHGTVQCSFPTPHSGTEVVLVREGPRAGGGLLTAEKGF